MNASPLSWGAQVAAHSAYVAAHCIPVAAPPVVPGVRRRTQQSAGYRTALLNVLRDGRSRRFAEIAGAMSATGLSHGGIRWILAQMVQDGLVAIGGTHNLNRTFRIAPQQETPHEH